MSLRRTTVYADEADLAVIKTAAARRGIPEAEIIRDAIHLAALAHRSWDEPFFTRTYQPDGERVRTDDVLADVWADEADAYEQTRNAQA